MSDRDRRRQDTRITVRPMSIDDVEAVVAIHLSAFQGFFLTFLGERFLHELYRAIVLDEESVVFVAVDGTRVIGFVAGAASPGLYRRAARRRWLAFGIASLSAFLRRPAILPRLLRALYAPPRPPSAGAPLMSLAVAPSMQRAGAGRQLTQAFLEGARRRGATAAVLTTDKWGNDAANAFYRAQGFTLAGEHVTPEGRAMNDYVIRFGSEGRA